MLSAEKIIDNIKLITVNHKGYWINRYFLGVEKDIALLCHQKAVDDVSLPE